MCTQKWLRRSFGVVFRCAKVTPYVQKSHRILRKELWEKQLQVLVTNRIGWGPNKSKSNEWCIIWHTFGTWWLGAAFFFAPLKVLGRAWIFSTGTGRALEKYCTKSHERWLDTSLVVGQQRWATSLGNIVATENLTAPKRSQKGSLALEARWPIHNWPISTATCHTEKRLQLRLCWFILFILFLLSKNSKSSFGIRWCNMMQHTVQHTVPVMPLAAPHWIHHSPRSIFNLCCFAAVLVALQSAKLRHCVLLMCFTVFHCVSLCFTENCWILWTVSILSIQHHVLSPQFCMSPWVFDIIEFGGFPYLLLSWSLESPHSMDSHHPRYTRDLV